MKPGDLQTRRGPSESPALWSGPCGRVLRPPPGAHGEGDVDEGDEDGHIDEGADGAGERLAAADAEHGDGHGDGEFTVVAGAKAYSEAVKLMACIKLLHGAANDDGWAPYLTGVTTRHRAERSLLAKIHDQNWQ